MDKKIIIMKTKSTRISIKYGIIAIAFMFSVCSSFAQIHYNTGCSSSTTLFSSAIGTNTSSTGNSSFTGGISTSASGQAGLAHGYYSTAIGNRAISLGEYCQANHQSYAIGQFALATSERSIAFGRFVRSENLGSMTIGCSQVGYELINNIQNSLMIGFNNTIPAFFVKGPLFPNTEACKVGINNSNPLQDFHVNGNILLTGLNSTILFADSPPTNGCWGKWGIEYETNGLNFWKPFDPGKAVAGNYNPKGTAGNYILFLHDNGNVGIGTNNPLTKLHVLGTAKISQNFTVGEAQSPASMYIYGPSVLNGALTVGEAQRPVASILNGTLQVTGLHSEDPSMIVADQYGNLGVAPIPIGDQMGSHIATRNLQMNDMFITNDAATGTNEGIFVAPSGSVGIKTNVFNSTNVDDDLVVTDPNTGPDTKSYLRVLSVGTKPAIVWTTGGSKTIGMGVINDKGYLIENFNNKDIKLMTFSKGKVGIGVSKETEEIDMPEGALLYVAGRITAEEVYVKLHNTWPDNVFEEKYKLMPLVEVEKFVAENKHLPEVPNQAEVQQTGIELGAMNALLLKKIEELTLYVIEQDKRIKELEGKK